MPQLLPDYPGKRRPPRIAYLRSLLPLVALVLIFSFLLASYSLLSHFQSPAVKQHIGWQAWDVVRVSSASDATTGANSTGDSADFVPSIPLDNWDPLALHTTGLTEIAVQPCYFPPSVFGSFCAPETTPELDKTKGKWVIVETDLNVRAGLWYLNIYYRRTRRLDQALITDIRVVAEPPPDTLVEELKGWIKADGDLHSGVWPSQSEARLWYKLQDGGGKRQSFSDNVITEVDLVFGDDDPFYGFERIQGGPVLPALVGKWESVDIAVRRGNPSLPKVSVPTFHSDGTLKILQIADLHYSVGDGKCKDTDKTPCVGDVDTAKWLNDALDAEKPDLVVFSGDQLNGQESSYDTRSVLAKFAKPVIDHKIPWCAVFGNHDSEIWGDREMQIRALSDLPYSLVRSGPKNVDGFGNYYLKLHSGDASSIHLFTLYFLDSGSYQKRTVPWKRPDYDYIKQSQIDWYLDISSNIQPIERPFEADGASDLDKIWHRRSGINRLPASRDDEKYLAKPNAMMWFHIPLQEAYNDADSAGSGDGYDSDPLDVGSQLDQAGASKHNSGFFSKAIKGGLQSSLAGQDQVAEVKVLSHGHCHNTDRCRRVDGIWMCFDGGSSYSGYGQLGFDRRVRVYQISEFGEKVETYKRLVNGDIVDHQVLVGSGAAPGVGKISA